MDDIVKDFLIESNENLDRLDQELVTLELDPASTELLSSIFRTIHTIKGTCSFLGFPRLEKLSHAGESLLARLRDGELLLTPALTSGLLMMVDAIRGMLTAIQQTGQDGKEDYAALIARLADLQRPSASQSTPTTYPPGAPDPATPQPDSTIKDAATSAPEPFASSRVMDEDLADPTRLGGLLLQRGLVKREDLARALHQQELGRKRLGEILIEQGAALPEDILAAQRTLESRNPEAAVDTIRIAVTLIDRLMNLVGELVLARNQLLQFREQAQDPAFLSVSQRLHLITRELQAEVMKTRMQPISNIWSKFPRTVRDLAHNCGKEVRLEMEGQDAELDRTIIETIKDPMTHLVRNAIGHGIELPQVRTQAGKEPMGLLRLRAFHEGGHVNIEVSDDGGGLNRKRILEKAIERGILTSQTAEHISDRDLFNLIFLPGFSTAETVTKVSGRGVGMDVVKTNVEKIGGTVEVHSAEGKGTTIKLKIPLTLAIIPALLVKAAGERFAVPQVSLLELIHLENGGKGIDMVHGAPLYRLRGRLLPLLFLSSELRLGGNGCETSDSPANIVVVQAHGCEFGLVVDEIIDSEEIVVKPLGAQLKGIAAYSGATIFGDGRVALILDVAGLAHGAGIISESRAKGKTRLTPVEAPPGRQRQTVLIVESGNSRRLAIPLSSVTRLEEFHSSAIERSGAQEVMQYRGQILPLIRLSKGGSTGMPESRNVPDTALQIVVCTESGRSMGLIVDRITDIVDEPLSVETPGQCAGILGASILQKRITEVLDLPALMREAKFYLTAESSVSSHQDVQRSS